MNLQEELNKIIQGFVELGAGQVSGCGVAAASATGAGLRRNPCPCAPPGRGDGRGAIPPEAQKKRPLPFWP